jgi:hypothetical protein
MSLSREFEDFYRRWMEKANNPGRNGLNDYFDGYFSLFVVFNRLYAETTFILGRRRQINLAQNTSFPDAKAAKTYVLQYLGSRNYLEKLKDNQATQAALEELKDLIRRHRFYIKLNILTGERQEQKDEELLTKLDSRGTGQRAEAVLDLLYSVRCNMFHGHKGFQEVQVDLLKPLSRVLKSTIEILYEKLNEDDD